MQVIGNLDGKLNELLNRKLQILNSDPGSTSGRFFFNNTDDRMKVADSSGGYRSVAWLTDLLGLSKWKTEIRAASTPADGNITLSGPQTLDGINCNIDENVLIKNQTDLKENGRYVVKAGAWIRMPDADDGAEVTNAMCIIQEGAVNGGHIWKNSDNDPLVLGTDDVHFDYLQMSVPMTDETVRVSAADTTEKYLRESFSNADAIGDALNNVNNLQVILENAGGNEILRLALSLNSYIGDINITGGLSVTGTSLLHNMSFIASSNINWDNTTNTGTQLFNNSYVANYDDSDINYNNNTVVTLDSTSTININGTTNYSSTSITNNDGGIVNNTNVTETNIGGTVNNYGQTINNSANPVALGCSGNLTVNVVQVDTAINADAEYADISITYDAGGANEWSTNITLDNTNTPQVVTDPGATYPGQITLVWNGGTGNIEATRDSGLGDFTIDICQFDLDANPTVVNNTNTETNNTNVTENYTSVFTPIGCSGATALPVDEAIDSNATKADVSIVYDDGTTTDTITVTVTEGMGIVSRDLLDGTITTERNSVSGNIEVRLTAGAGTGTADVCQFSGGSIINNNGTIENNTDNIVNNDNTTTNNTSVEEYYDEDSTVVNEGDVYNENLTVENISYASTFVAGENLTNRQPLRMGVASLGEDTAKVYGANSTDADHSEFIGFASKDTLADEEVSVLQGPRVSGLKDVYGALTDTSTYYLTDGGGISLTAGTVNVRIGDADGDDTLVGLNAPIPEASKVPPKQLKADNVGAAGQVATFVNDDTFHWADGAGGSMTPHQEDIADSGTDIVLSDIPVGGEKGLLVLKRDSGMVYFTTDDYTYDAVTNIVTLNTALTAGEKAQVRYWSKGGAAPVSYSTNSVTTDTATLTIGSFNLITYSTGDVTLTLPDPNAYEGEEIMVKKRTGNSSHDVIIKSVSGNVEGVAQTTFNSDRAVYGWVAVDGNRYTK